MLENPNEELKNPEIPESAPEQSAPAEAPKPQEDDFEAFYSEILKEFGPQTNPHPARKKTSGHTGKTQAEVAVQNSQKHTGKKKQSIKGLVITLCLELAGIAGIVLWWVFRIL